MTEGKFRGNNKKQTKSKKPSHSPTGPKKDSRSTELTLVFYKQYVLHLINENTILRNKVDQITNILNEKR